MKLARKNFLFPLLLFVNTVIIFLVWERPTINSTLYFIDLYRSALREPMPDITFLKRGIRLVGELPVVIHLRDSVDVIFDQQADSLQLLSRKKGSILIRDDYLFYRTESGVRTFALESITIDSVRTMSPDQLRRKVDKYYIPAVTAIYVATIVMSLLAILLINLFGAGIGVIVDAFTEGPFSYRQMLNVAGFLLFLWIALLAGLHAFLPIGRYLAVLFLAGYFVSVAVVVRLGREA